MNPQRSLLLITHYHRLLEYIRPHVVHVMIDGRIIRSGSVELALELEKERYR
jgi:Fe-S cluster assembly ATP-binding protein